VAVKAGGLGHERGKEGTGLRKRRMARRSSIIEKSACITDKMADEWNNSKRRSLNYQVKVKSNIVYCMED